MPKPWAHHVEPDGIDSTRSVLVTTPEPHELVEQTTSGPCPAFDEVQHFVDEHNLSSHVDVFRKAALVLRGELTLDEIPHLSQGERQSLQDERGRKWRQPKMLYFTVLVCSLGAVEQGWAQTGMNGANLTFPKAFGIDSQTRRDTFIVGFINSGIYLSTGLVGAWSSDSINNRLARRGTIMLGACLCLISNLGAGMSSTWKQLLCFRMILGVGLGLNASTVSVFQAECAPAQIRGGLAVQWQMWTAFGIFLGFVANTAFYSFGDDAWRWQVAAPFLPTVPLLCMIYTCPESPAWHIKHGKRYDRAFQCLRTLRTTDLVAAKEIYSSSQQDQIKVKSQGQELSFWARLYDLVTVPRIRRAATASYVVMLSQQLCGINIIAFYSSTIFSDAGFSTYGALVASCVFGFVNFVGAFPAVWSMDTASLSFALPAGTSAHFGLLATLIYLFCALYSPGMGPVPNTYSAEVFPLSHREVGMSMAVSTANFWAAVLSITFPRILSAFQASGAFALYAILNVVALILVFLFVPETRLKTLDELDDVFAISSRTFIRHQVTSFLPWLWKRYLLRDQHAELRPLEASGDYQQLDQDELEQD
ncbi:hypothetical protein B0A52_00656 [Exophiala mesophila]|uniref:Major facilitator superfamily (MFS) profile domain-containing protein n=1 Tax=Exophiala mesophila TaxID=212818 RepID=A0A438NHW0_EXOME|nr:hypothetical protein B0A52_00656 [Exophiala mesophila]